MNSADEMFVGSSHSDRALVIMAKAPSAGTVKTRLIPQLSATEVTAFYHCLLHDTLTLAESLGDVEVAIMCPEPDVDDLTQFAARRARVAAQTGQGLAAGLASVFAQFTAHRTRAVIAFNSDSPHLPSSVLERAFETLAAHDLVVGPTQDGGYYLVGAKASHPSLFATDGMGTSSALNKLLSRAHALDLSVGFADSFYDIDVFDDLIHLADELRVAPSRAPLTAGWLEERGLAKVKQATGSARL